jgi:ABC-type thiamin/hydroxymethylpyrimidine transport system permease subunit
MSTQKKVSLKDWTTRDLMVTTAISIVFGLVMAGINYLA